MVKEIKVRENGTFGRSAVLGSGSQEVEVSTNEFHNAQNVKRDDQKWKSSVFGGPVAEQSKKKKLNFNDKGRDGLFGNSMEPDAYAKKTNLAATISTKEPTRDPIFDNSADHERKARELYGNSNYKPPKKENNRQFAPP